MRTPEEIERWMENRKLPTEEVVKRLPDNIRPFAFIVGVWVWVVFESKPEKEILTALSDLGFSWNSKRKAWQHPCGVFKPRAPYDPRTKYAQIPIDDLAGI